MTGHTVEVFLDEELYGLVQQACTLEHWTPSEVIQEALRAHFREPVYHPTNEERSALAKAVGTARSASDSVQNWEDVREALRDRR